MGSSFNSWESLSLWKSSGEMVLCRSHSSGEKPKTMRRRRRRGQQPLNLSIKYGQGRWWLARDKTTREKIDPLFPPWFVWLVFHRPKAEYLNTIARSLVFITKIGKKSVSLVKVHGEALVVSSVGRDCCKGFKYYPQSLPIKTDICLHRCIFSLLDFLPSNPVLLFSSAEIQITDRSVVETFATRKYNKLYVWEFIKQKDVRKERDKDK